MPDPANETLLSETAFIAPLKEGLQIGDLTLVRPLGQGAQGVVWEAQQASMDRRVAVKILPVDLADNATKVERFKREAEAAGRLTHPHIVSTYAFQEWKGMYLIVLELVHGGDLEQSIERLHSAEATRTDELQRWAAQTAWQLALALEHAHEHGVIHRDVKPGNVLIGEDDTAKLTDFGLAKVEDDRGLTRTGVAMGTPYYMSPEQVRAEHNVLDHRTDIYSLGAVLYRMLTGVVPFSGNSREGLLLDILGRDPRPPRKRRQGIDRDLEAICLKCLEKSPARRYASAAELALDLQAWMNGEAITARLSTVVDMPFRRMRRLASSGLVLLSLLWPVVWLSLDQIVLRPLVEADPSAYRIRQLSLGLATALFMWPLCVLGVRLCRGLRWVRVPIILVAMALGGWKAWDINREHLNQLQGESRLTLQTAVLDDHHEIIRRTMNEHLENWLPRFGTDDHVTMARAHLQLNEPSQALSWAALLDASGADNPVVHALRYAVHYSLGEDEIADGALQRMIDTVESSRAPADCLVAGDILADMHFYDLAQAVYRTAGKQPDVDLYALTYVMARLNEHLCRWEEAGEDVASLARWSPDRVDVKVRMHKIAVGRQDWVAAERTLQELKPRTDWYFDLKYRYLKLREGRAAARQFALDMVEQFPQNAWLLTSAAGRLFTDNFFDDCRDLYERLALLEPHNIEARIGLGAAHLMQGRYDLADSETRSALRIQPENGFALYNASQVVLFEQMAQFDNDLDRWTLDAWERWQQSLQRVLSNNGLHVDALNNSAYALGRIYKLSGDRTRLDQGYQLVHRAVRLSERQTRDRCTENFAQRKVRSRNLDTLAQLYEWDGDLPAAVDAAKKSLEALADDDPDVKIRNANLSRLQALSEGD